MPITIKSLFEKNISLQDNLKTDINQKLDSKLPLTGGTLTDSLRFNVGSSIGNGGLMVDKKNHNLVFSAHGTTQNGPSLVLWGDSGTVDAGNFNLSAKNGSSGIRYSLTGRNSGTLTWNGKFLLNSTENNYNADQSVAVKFPFAWADTPTGVIPEGETSGNYKQFDRTIGAYDSTNTKVAELTFRGTTSVAEDEGDNKYRSTVLSVLNPWVNKWSEIAVNGYEDYSRIRINVADATSNGELIGKSDKTLTWAGQKVHAGNFTVKNQTVASAVTCATSAKTYDLSSYLPDDGFTYMVLCIGRVTTGSTSGNDSELRVYSDILSSGSYIWLGKQTTRSSSNMTNMSSCWIPVGTGRKLYAVCGATTGTFYIYARGYYRLYK